MPPREVKCQPMHIGCTSSMRMLRGSGCSVYLLAQTRAQRHASAKPLTMATTRCAQGFKGKSASSLSIDNPMLMMVVGTAADFGQFWAPHALRRTCCFASACVRQHPPVLGWPGYNTGGHSTCGAARTHFVRHARPHRTLCSLLLRWPCNPGYCTGIRKDGGNCTMPVNTSKGYELTALTLSQFTGFTQPAASSFLCVQSRWLPQSLGYQ